MRALAAVVALAVFACSARAHLAPTPRALLAALGINNQSPMHNILSCGVTLGPTKCLSAFSAYRAEKALDTIEKRDEFMSNLTADARQFPWEQYVNSSEEALYSQLSEGTEKLLRYKSFSLNMIPGYSLKLESKANGKFSFDVLKRNDESTGRDAMKKLQKQFYDLVPILIIPGLIMSAVLPFVLPGLKLLTVMVGMINNMALSGAVFTLLRNNAFNDHYEKKVVYVNEGYKNEKISPYMGLQDFNNDPVNLGYAQDFGIPLDTVDLHYAGSELQPVVNTPVQGNEFMEVPTNADWMGQYYGSTSVANSNVVHNNIAEGVSEINAQLKQSQRKSLRTYH